MHRRAHSHRRRHRRQWWRVARAEAALIAREARCPPLPARTAPRSASADAAPSPTDGSTLVATGASSASDLYNTSRSTNRCRQLVSASESQRACDPRNADVDFVSSRSPRRPETNAFLRMFLPTAGSHGRNGSGKARERLCF